MTSRPAYVVRRVRREIRDRVLATGAADPKIAREDVAARYLRGDGIEIGAFNFPLRLPRGARVRYVDYQSADELRATYADLLVDGKPLVEPDIVDDGARLATFPDGSVDFVVANHMLEHTEDPIGALEHHVRVLRPGGVLFLTLPDGRRTFDARRPRTTVEHLLRDHAEGPEVSQREHYEECARLIECVAEEDVERRVREFEEQGARIHFHVWEPQTFVELLGAIDLPLDLELVQSSGDEFIVVLRRRDG